MKNTGNEDLTMYVVSEPTPHAFVPGTAMLVTDERQVSGENSDGCVPLHDSRRIGPLGRIS